MADGNVPNSGQSYWAGSGGQQPGGPQQQPPQYGRPNPPSTPVNPTVPGATSQQPQQQPTPGFWAHNATADPWRNPRTSAVVPHAPAPALPPTEPPITPKPAGKTPGLGLVITVAVIAALVAGGLGAALTTYALKSSGGGTISQPGGERPLGDYQEVIAQVLPSVVTVWVEGRDGSGNGSGWIYSSEGYIVTNHHVAALAEGDSSAKMTVQFSDGHEVPAEVVGAAESTDIAVLKIDEADAEPLTVADSNSLAVGDPVIAIGAPLGFGQTVTDGIVSAIDRPIALDDEGQSTVMAAVQTDAAINPGNSGGPLLDASGQVIGVNTLIYSFPNQDGEAGDMGLGFAIPGVQAARVAEDIIDDGKATKPVLGTELAETKAGETGAKVKDVPSGTPAADAGLAKDDVITEFNGTKVLSDVQLEGLVLKQKPGDKVTVTYQRDGTEASADVELGSAEDK